MRRLLHATTIAVAIALVAPTIYVAAQMDPDRVVPGGGIFVTGWQGKIPDVLNATNKDRKITDSKLSGTAAKMDLNSGPAGIFWNPANVAKGDFTIKGTFSEPKVKSANSHAHPYGIFIGGNKLDTDQNSLLYCTAYGERNQFLVRGFGPAVFNVTARGSSNPAVKVAGADGAVSQEIAFSVKGDNVSCSINGTEVWTAKKADIVGAGKLESTDGIFGIRISHNTDVVITGFGKS